MIAARVVGAIPIAEDEFLMLPPPIRETFISAFLALEESHGRTTSGVGWHTEQLRQNQRIIPGGLFSIHVGPMYRGVFARLGGRIHFLAFGAHIPHTPRDDVYSKLRRAREFVERPSEPRPMPPERPAGNRESISPTARSSGARSRRLTNPPGGRLTRAP